MEPKSNITIASNVYISMDNNVAKDPEFVRNCRGFNALNDIRRRLGTDGPVTLTPAQIEEMREDRGCVFALDRQMTHGAVKRGDEIVWECRCEYETCSRFAECMPNPIVRVSDSIPIFQDVSGSREVHYEWLGEIEEIFAYADEMQSEPEEETAEEEPIPPEYLQPLITITGEFIKVEDRSTIVEAEIDSRILINAGPGAGKTHTVIERLGYLITSGNVDPGQVLVLCYTNAARDVITDRLAEKGLSAEARQLVICTLDSLAWNNLSQKTEDDLFSLGFNGCIQRFNAEFDAEEWSDFEYVVIDELQDLVNERAKMTLNILGALRCGFLLLGDKCQAIYDYDCNGAEKINSIDFYHSLDTILPDDTAKYELLGDYRQSTELAQRSNCLREVLLQYNASDVNEYFDLEINKMESVSFSPNYFTSLPPNSTTAILTRNNGEAEWISAKLHRKHVPHNLLRSVNSSVSLHRWIADMFWDYRRPRIDKSDFVERYLVRVSDNVDAATSAFDAIIDLLSAVSFGVWDDAHDY